MGWADDSCRDMDALYQHTSKHPWQAWQAWVVSHHEATQIRRTAPVFRWVLSNVTSHFPSHSYLPVSDVLFVPYTFSTPRSQAQGDFALSSACFLSYLNLVLV